MARTILYDEQESKDVVSDIFEGLLRGQTVLMPDTEERYLLTSVRNQCLKRIRHQEMRHRIEAAPAEQPSDAEDNDSRCVTLSLRYRFNVTPSKYKGTGAGNAEKNRL